MKQEIVTMSAKGQLVVPREVRAEVGLEPGERFVAFPVPEGVVFKKIDLTKKLNQLAKEMSKRARKYNVTEKDIEEAIRDVRKGGSGH